MYIITEKCVLRLRTKSPPCMEENFYRIGSVLCNIFCVYMRH